MPVPQIVEFLKTNLNSIIALLVAVGASFIVAKRYGDLAGAAAAISYEEEKSRRARVAAFRALLNQVDLAEKLAQANAEGHSILEKSRGLVRLPVQAFETAFVSGEPILSDDRELLSAVNDYLTEAYIINSVISLHLSHETGPGNSETTRTGQQTVDQVRKACRALPQILTTLRGQLKADLLKDANGESETAA